MKVTLEPNILDNAGVLDANFTGKPVETMCIYGFGVQLNVTETAALTGVFKVQHSHDGINYFDSNIFKSITLTALAANASYGFSGGTNVANESLMIPWKWSRIVWTWTSGTGFVTSIIGGARV